MINKMRIGIAGPILTDSLSRHLNIKTLSYPSGLGGTNVNNLINSLLDSGYTVSVYTLSEDITKEVTLRGENLTIFYAPLRVPRKLRIFDVFYKEHSAITEFILLDKPDIVHAHWSYEYAIGTIRSRYPHLITVRDEPVRILKLTKEIYRLLRLLMHMWVIRNGRNFSAVSPYIREKVLKNRRAEVIPNFITWETGFPKSLRCKSTVRILSILTGWSPIKNPIPALKAYKLVRKRLGKAVEYHIYGPGFETDGAGYKWAKENGLSEGVVFHGNVSTPELMKKIVEYDLLLHPSREESFGNSLIEGMSFGLPVIGGISSGAVPWVLEDGNSGILVDVESPDQICDAIVDLITDFDKYELLSRNGIINLNKRFSREVIVAKYIKYYEEIISAHQEGLVPGIYNNFSLQRRLS